MYNNYAIGGLEATEGYLSTTVDLTKQVKPNFACSPSFLGDRVAVKWQQNRRKGSLCIIICIGRCHKWYLVLNIHAYQLVTVILHISK